MFADVARTVIRRCRSLATCSEEPGFTTRTFLSHPMRNVHDDLSAWMSQAGMQVGVDAVGNLRGILYAGTSPDAPRLFIGSHLDTVPRAGAFDGVLGVVMGIALVDMLAMRRWLDSIEVIGFWEEEGVRFGLPFIGSRALVGSIDEATLATRDTNGTSVREAIAGFGLDRSRIAEARTMSPALGYLEFHIEQGPVLDMRGLAIAVVERIVGLSRAEVRFTGVSAHAGTTPMNVRRDARLLAQQNGSAASNVPHTTCLGSSRRPERIEVAPGATNVIPGECRAMLDVRHAEDVTRLAAVERFRSMAAEVAMRRGLTCDWHSRLEHPATGDESAAGRHARTCRGPAPARRNC